MSLGNKPFTLFAGLDISDFQKNKSLLIQAIQQISKTKVDPSMFDGLHSSIVKVDAAANKLSLTMKGLQGRQVTGMFDLGALTKGKVQATNVLGTDQSSLKKDIQELNVLYGQYESLRSQFAGAHYRAATTEGPLAQAFEHEKQEIEKDMADIERTVAQYQATAGVAFDASRWGDTTRRGFDDRGFARKMDVTDAKIDNSKFARDVAAVNELYRERKTLFQDIQNAQTRITTAGPFERKFLTEQVAAAQQGIDSLDSKIGTYSQSVIDASNASNVMTDEFNAQAKAAEQTARQLDQQRAQVDQLAKRVTQITAMLAARVMYQGLKEGINYAIQYHNILNEIRVVTLKSQEEADALGAKFRSMANDLKTPSSEIAEVAVAWYRQGLDDKQVEERLVSANKLARVAAIDMETSTRMITTAINSGMVETAEQASDVLVSLGDAAATSAQEIGTAMQRSASSAKAAGVSYEWLATYITLVSEKTRLSADMIGTAMRATFARLHQIRARGFADEDGTTLNQIQQAMANINKEIGTQFSLLKEDNKTWRDSSEVIAELAASWHLLNDKQASYLMTSLAGIRQQDIMIALMNGMTDSFEGTTRGAYLYNLAMEAAGSTQQKFEITLQSAGAAQNDFRASLEDMYSALVDGDAIVTFLNNMTAIVDTFSAGIKAMGGFDFELLAVVASLLVAVSVVSQLSSAIGGVAKALTAAGALAKTTGVIASISSAIPAIALAIVGLGAAFVYATGKAEQLADPIKSVEEEMSRLQSGSDRWSKKISDLETFKNKLIDLDRSSVTASEKQRIYNGLVEDLIKSYPHLANSLRNTAGDWYYLSNAISTVNAEMERMMEIRAREANVNAHRAMQAMMKEVGNEYDLIDRANKASEYLTKVGRAKDEYLNYFSEYDTFGVAKKGLRQSYENMLLDKDMVEFFNEYANSFGYYGKLYTDRISEEYANFLLNNRETIDDALDYYKGVITDAAKLRFFEIGKELETIARTSNEYIGGTSHEKALIDSYTQAIFGDMSKAISESTTEEEVKRAIYDARDKIDKVAKTALAGGEGFADNYDLLGLIFEGYIKPKEDGGEIRKNLVQDYSEQLVAIIGDSYEEVQKNLEKTFPEGYANEFWGYIADAFFAGVDPATLKSYVDQGVSSFNLLKNEIARGISAAASKYGDMDGRYAAARDRVLGLEYGAEGTPSTTDLLKILGIYSTDNTALETQINEATAILADGQKRVDELASKAGKYTAKEVIGVGGTGEDKDEPTAGEAALGKAAEADMPMLDAEKIAYAERLLGLLKDIRISTSDLTEEIAASQETIDDALFEIGEELASMGEAGVKIAEDMLPGFGYLIKRLQDGTISAEEFQKRVSDLSSELDRKTLRSLERSGKALSGVSDIMEDFAKGNVVDANKKLGELTKSLPKTINALNSLRKIQSGTVKDTKELKLAWEDLAEYYGRSVEELQSMDMSFFDELAGSADAAMLSLEWLYGQMNSVGQSTFNSANWQAELAALGASGDDAAAIMSALIATIQLLHGVRVNATPDGSGGMKFSVSGLGSAPRSGGGGKKGGGGGGSKKGEEEITKISEELQKFIDQLDARKKLQDFVREMIVLTRTFHETRGELTAVITLMGKEIEHIEKMQEADIEAEAALRKRMEAKQAEIKQYAITSREYAQAALDLEELQEQHQEYSNQIQQNINDMEALRKEQQEHRLQIRQLEIDLRDLLASAFDDRDARLGRMLSARIQIEEEILSAIEARYRAEWDLIKKDLDEKRKAYNDELKLIRDNLNARKKAQAEADKYKQLGSLEDQLSRISADPTRAKDREELLKKIAKLREELAWDAAEKEVESQETSIKKQIESLDKYLEYINKFYDDMFENPQVLIAEMNEIMQGANTEMREWLEDNYIGFTELTAQQQEDAINKMYQMAYATDQQLMEWLTTNITGFAALNETTQKQMMENVRTMAQNADDVIISWLKENNESFANATAAKQQEMVMGWGTTLNDMRAVTVRYWSEIEDIITQGDDAIIQFLKDNVEDYRLAGQLQADAYVDEWRKKLADLRAAYVDTAAEFSQLANQYQQFIQSPPSQPSSGSSGSSGGGSKWKIKDNVNNQVLSKEFASKAEAQRYIDEQIAYYGRLIETQKANLVAAQKKYDSAGVQKALDEIKRLGIGLDTIKKATPVRAYSRGGMADYTGLAMVHGSPREPEAFLSATDTKNIRTMLDNLVHINKLMTPVELLKNQMTSPAAGGLVIESINISVDKLDTDQDMRELAERVSGHIFREMTVKQGAPVSGSLRY